MKHVRLTVAGCALALGLCTAAPVVAQDLDLPGMGVLPGDAGARQTAGGDVNLPGSRTATKAAGESGDLGGTTRPAASKAASGERSLPATGAAISGLALLGVALVSGGRLLVELAPKRA